jgi:hypothetical protein
MKKPKERKKFYPKKRDKNKFINVGTPKFPILVRKDVQNIYRTDKELYTVKHPIGFNLIGSPAFKVGHSDILLAKEIIKYEHNQEEDAIKWAQLIIKQHKAKGKRDPKPRGRKKGAKVVGDKVVEPTQDTVEIKILTKIPKVTKD